LKVHHKKRFISYELFLFLLLSAFVVTIGLINPAFFSIGTMFDVIRNQTLYILLGIGLLPVVIMGGFDISFPAVAALATFAARALLGNLEINGTIWHYYLFAITAGIMVGLLIGWTIWRFKLSIFNFSLGVSNMITGIMVLISNIDTNWGRIEGLSGWNMRWLVTAPFNPLSAGQVCMYPSSSWSSPLSPCIYSYATQRWVDPFMLTAATVRLLSVLDLISRIST